MAIQKPSFFLPTNRPPKRYKTIHFVAREWFKISRKRCEDGLSPTILWLIFSSNKSATANGKKDFHTKCLENELGDRTTFCTQIKF
jgi:hypothetical protein